MPKHSKSRKTGAKVAKQNRAMGCSAILFRVAFDFSSGVLTKERAGGLRAGPIKAGHHPSRQV